MLFDNLEFAFKTVYCRYLLAVGANTKIIVNLKINNTLMWHSGLINFFKMCSMMLEILKLRGQLTLLASGSMEKYDYSSMGFANYFVSEKAKLMQYTTKVTDFSRRGEFNFFGWSTSSSGLVMNFSPVYSILLRHEFKKDNVLASVFAEPLRVYIDYLLTSFAVTTSQPYTEAMFLYIIKKVVSHIRIKALTAHFISQEKKKNVFRSN